MIGEEQMHRHSGQFQLSLLTRYREEWLALIAESQRVSRHWARWFPAINEDSYPRR